MTPTSTPQRHQTSDRLTRVRRALTLAAATFLIVAGSAAAQLPALPVGIDQHTSVTTQYGSFAADIKDRSIQACADAYASTASVPVPLPLPALPQAAGRSCIDADVDQMRAGASVDGSYSGVADPTGLLPTNFGLDAAADLDDQDIELDANSDSSIAQQAMDGVTDAAKTVWSTVRGLF